MGNQNHRVGLAEIAKIVGISKGAVSLALKESLKISPERRARVKAVAKKLGYRSNPLLSTVMSSISGGGANFLETIVLINANRAENAPKRFPIFAEYISGIRAEARELGYGLYSIWLHEPNLTSERLKKILESRGIRGGVIIGHIDDTILPETFSDIWRDFKFVSAGLRTVNPIFDFISADKFLIAQYSTSKIIRNGFKRPAIVIDSRIDELVEGRFVGGFLRAQLSLPEKSRVPPFMRLSEARAKPAIFLDWLAKYKPDAIFSVSHDALSWLERREISSRIPANIKLVRLERKDDNDWQAIDKNYELVGRLAVRKLFEILNAPARMRGINAATCTIVQPHWNRTLNLENF